MTRTIHPILIVEDDTPTQMLLETLVQRHGYASVTAPNGQAAIDLLGARDFTAVILDLMMPEVGGADVIAFLARARKGVPVIVCTAAGLDKTAELGPEIVSAVLRKPFDIEVLMTTIFGLTRHGMPSTVLIVDDDVKARYALKALLAPAESLEAENADQALAIVRERRPEVVVAVESAAERLAGADVPVVIIVSKQLDDRERAALLQRAAAVIERKNLSRQTLTDVFDVVLRRG
jgi:DNA-binding response OmpR family regulator